jgi:hypothetical protein
MSDPSPWLPIGNLAGGAANGLEVGHAHFLVFARGHDAGGAGFEGLPRAAVTDAPHFPHFMLAPGDWSLNLSG